MGFAGEAGAGAAAPAGGTGEAAAGRAGNGADRSLRVIVPEASAEVAGALLMEKWGPFEAVPAAPPSGATALVFYPQTEAVPTLEEVLASLPSDLREPGLVRLETVDVSRDWVEGWKAHFRPITVGEVRIRPPWEPALGFRRTDGAAASAAGAPAPPPGTRPPVDVVINPGLGFGTGLHPTTRGTLGLLQHKHKAGTGPVPLLGPLVDAGTGSGILAIAAAKLGWGPVFAFDNDPDALKSARENIDGNGVGGIVELHRADLEQASRFWFAGATVIANMTLEPVLALVRRLAHEAPGLKGLVESEWPVRLVVSGILAGEQEAALVTAAGANGFVPGQRVYETEWVSLELFPTATGAAPAPETPAAGAPLAGTAGASSPGSR